MWENRCHGGGGADGTHCCWVGGEVCPNLRENVGGRRFACAVAAEVDGDPEAWRNHPDYLPIAERWREAEQRAGLPAGALDCPTWPPPDAEPQCCFAEDPDVNRQRYEARIGGG